MLIRVTIALVMGCLLAGPGRADDRWDFDKCRITGTWLVNISFPDIGLQFQELLSLHRGGTLTETNSGLHANSFPDPNAALPPPQAPPALNGSDGHGAEEGCVVDLIDVAHGPSSRCAHFPQR